MNKVFHFWLTEVRKALPPTLFFMVVFHLNLLVRHLDEESYGITPGRSFIATIGALVLGKVYLLLGDRDWVNCFRNRPLIFATLWKTLIFSTVATLVLMAEDIIPLAWHNRSLVVAWQMFVQETQWQRYWANHIFLLLWTFIYTAGTELIGSVGKDQVRKLFFGR